MVHANDILESFVVACRQHSDISDDVTFATVELDADGDHSDVSPPIIEFTIEDIERDMSRNTERYGVEIDEDGLEIGYIYKRWYDMTVVAEVFTVSGSSWDHRTLDQDLRQTLYRYDSHGLNQQLPDPDNPTEPLGDVSWVFVEEVEPNNDFSMSPSVRTRLVSIDVGFTHEIRTTDLGIEYDVVEDVKVPTTATSDTSSKSIDLESE